ncbi:adenine phosphoribosyltransferase [Brevibacillus dissolubilis]|uniref:adenine phosphoribosyltransferase n=1 Tax=Brevibacillus dissolubilis TaxID=1844116 RepID=UPI001115EBF6|nr:adenine phosphoribosyltransferase [Brevibacillus dissolubilis]
MNFKEYIRVIPDYPQPGIRFKDITTLLQDGAAYRAAIDELAEFAKQHDIEVIAGPEARGFVVGTPLSYALEKGFVPVRKANKLPYKSIQADYSLEYGKDSLAMHVDAIKPGQRVLIADDLLATGGTIATTIKLIEELGGVVVAAAFFIELSYLEGRKVLGDIPVHSLVQY